MALIEESKQKCRFLIVLSKLDLIEEDLRPRKLLEIRSLLRISYLQAWCQHAVVIFQIKA